MTDSNISRRNAFKIMGAGAGLPLFFPETSGLSNPAVNADIRKALEEKVASTPFIDTHEHLPDEKVRLSGNAEIGGRCNDWTLVLSHYLDSDMKSAGMSERDYRDFFSPGLDPVRKWKLIEPLWPFIRNTGYGRAVRISIRRLYGVDDLSEATVSRVQEGYESLLKTGFYGTVLREMSRIESCQVNAWPILLSETPDFLMTDINAGGMIEDPGGEIYTGPAGMKAPTLSDWHRVIDWWFDRYGRYAAGVKVSTAYSRNIDFEKVPAEDAAPAYAELREGRELRPDARKKLQDHVFWYAVERATERGLPVKLHTGYYAQGAGKEDFMPLDRVRRNPSAACDLCRLSPDTRFVFFHIGYPYYEEMIALAKQYPNAVIDMCWSWILNPIAAKDFLKKFLVAAPANKLLTFGGDYIPVEPVYGHSVMARQGIVQALAELTADKWMSLDEAVSLCDTLMHENARRIFNLEEKYRILKNLDWNRI